MSKNNGTLNSLKQAAQAKRVTLAEWRASRYHEETLPSGLSVVLRDATMMDLILTGKLPPAVMDFAQEAEKDGRADIDLKELAAKGADMGTLVTELTRICLVSPMIGDVADDEHITLAELSADDKMFIMNWANREVSVTKPFREGQAEPVAVI